MHERPWIISGGLVTEGGRITGAWILDHHALTIPALNPGKATVMRALGRHEGRAVGVLRMGPPGMVRPPGTIAEVGDGASPVSMAFCAFLTWLAEARRDLDDPRWAPTVIGERAREVPSVAGLDDIVGVYRSELSAALLAVQPFLEGLDPFAREVAFETGDISDALYGDLDATFNADAPFARLVRMMPGLLRTAMDLRVSILHDIYGDDVCHDRAELVEALRFRLSNTKVSTTPERVEGILRLGALFAEMPILDRRTCRRLMTHSDPVTVLSDSLNALPRSWTPSTGAEWVGLVRCVDLLHFALGSCELVGMAGFVGGKGRWAQLANKLADADGRIDVSALTDMGIAFAEQVVRPTCPHLLPLESRLTAHALLFSGRGFHRMSEMARAWHRRQGAILTDVPEIEGDTWGKGLPDWSHDGVSVVVLDSARLLTAEGASGIDGNGQHGLRHCVGGYASRCRQGTRRIVSMRSGGPDGRRLSTAEFDVSAEPRLVQHRGMSNGEPPREAEDVIAAYASALLAGGLPIDRDALRETPLADRISSDAGYDVSAPGAVATVFEAWRPLLPRSLRSAGLEGLPTLVEGTVTEGGRWWRSPGHRSAPDPLSRPEACVPGSCHDVS